MSLEFDVLRKLHKPLMYVIDPFTVIKSNKLEFFIWFVFTILAGQLGILANIIIRYFSHSISVGYAVYLDSVSGSFYTYAIAISASALGPLFANFIKNNRPEFTSVKIVYIIITIFFLIISGIIYAAVQMKTLSYSLINSQDINLTLDTPQFLIYIISIFIGLYSYCLLKIKTPEYAHLDDSFNAQDDKNIKKVVTESTNLSDDGAGVKL